MPKRLIALITTVLLLLAQSSAVSAEEKNVLEMDTLFRADFANGLKAEVGDFSGSNIEVQNNNGDAVLKANATASSAQFIAYAKGFEPCEATLISFDMQFDKNTTRGYMDIIAPAKDGKYSFNMDEMSRALYVTQTGVISYFQSFMPPCGTFVTSALQYQTNRWYHFDMWLDYANLTVYYFIDGTEIGFLPIAEDFKGVGGFRFTVENMNGGANYLFDNIQIINFPERGAKVDLQGVAVPENFEMPVTIDYKTDENELGFIFMQKDVEFTASFLNVQKQTENVRLELTITDEENRVVEIKDKELSIASGAEEKHTFGAHLDIYGFYYLNTVVKRMDTEEVLSEKKFQFSVVNAPPEGQKNKKIGLTDHTADGHGVDEMDRKVELFSKAGVNTFRADYSKYITDYQSGTFELDDVHQRYVDTLAQNDMTAMVILSFSKLPPITAAEYEEWDAYVESVVTQLKGKKVIYEVWNEYNGPGFNYVGATSKDYTELLKHTYPIIKRIDPTAQVNGLVASPTIKPNYEMDAIDWIREVFEYGGGEYMDAACIHTYTHSVPEDFYSKRGIFIKETRELLDEFGYQDMKIEVSEMGWTTPGVTDEIGQASYIVRWAALYYDQVNEIDWYVTQEKQTTSSSENGFGFIRSWTKQYTGDYLPYSAKPAFLSMSNFNALMTDAVFEKAVKATEGGAYLYQFLLPSGQRALIAWNSSGQKETMTVKLDAAQATLYDLYGNPTQLIPLDGRYTFDISGEPIYLIGAFEECTEAEQVFYNLTASIEATEDDIAYLQFKNESGADVELELSLPVNITESSRDEGRISLITGNNSVENENIHVRVLDKQSNACYYTYEVPVIYQNIVSYTLKPSYFRNGHWNAVIELKNNKYSGNISGVINLKEPVEMAETSSSLRFDDLLPRSTKRIHIPVPQQLAGAHINIVSDIVLDNGTVFNDVESSVYMTAMSQMKQPPTIDGKLDYGEWDKTMPILINKEEQIKLEPDWSGPDDLSAKIYCSFDNDCFYLAAEVQDDILCDVDAQERVWACDSIQFAFAKANNSSAARTEYGIGLVNGTPKVDRYSFIGVDTGILMEEDVTIYEGVELKVTREGTVTTYEAKFPWEQIYGEETDISNLSQVYFSILVNENDGAGRNGWLEYCGGIGEGKDAAQFIPITLHKK